MLKTPKAPSHKDSQYAQSRDSQQIQSRDKSPFKPTLQKEPETPMAKLNLNEEDSKYETDRSSVNDEEPSQVEPSYDPNDPKNSKLLPSQALMKLPDEQPKIFNNTICNDHHNLLQNIIDRSHQIDWDIPLKPRKKFIGHIGKPEHFCWGHGAHLTEMISCDDMGQVIHWSGRKGKKITVFNLGVPLIWIDMEPQTGRFSIAGSTNGSLFLLELNHERNGKVVKGSGRSFGIEAHKGAVTACKFLSSNIIVSGSTDKSLSVWDLDERSSQISKHTCHDGAITSIDVSSDDPNVLLTASLDKTVKIWDIRVKNPVQHEYKKHLGAVSDVEFLPGMMSCFASAGDDGSVRMFDLRVTKELAIFIDKMNHHALNSISFSPSGRVIVAATEDRRVKAWDTLYDADPFQYFDYGFQVPIQWTKLSRDGFTMAILGKDGVLGIAY